MRRERGFRLRDLAKSQCIPLSAGAQGKGADVRRFAAIEERIDRSSYSVSNRAACEAITSPSLCTGGVPTEWVVVGARVVYGAGGGFNRFQIVVPDSIAMKSVLLAYPPHPPPGSG